MKTGLAIMTLLAVVALTGWADAGDDAASLDDRVKALEARLAAMEKGDAGSDLRVRSITVVDEAGKARVSIGSWQGYQGVFLNDATGRQRVALHTHHSGGDARMTFKSSAGDARLDLSLTAESPRVSIRSPKSHVLIKASIDRAAGIGIWGGPGKQNEKSHAGYWIWDDGTIAWGGGQRSAGRTGFLLKQSRDGRTEFKVRDHQEALLWEMPQPSSDDK